MPIDVLKHWKQILFVALPIAAFIAGATIHPQPARVVTQEKVVYQDRIVFTDREVKVEVDHTNINKHIEHTKVTTPDGTVTEKTVTDSDKHVDVKTDTERVVTKTEFVDRIVEKTVTIDNQKRFRVGLLVGVQPQILPVPMINSYAVGGEFDVRVIGPLWAGVWGMGLTSGQVSAGIALGFEF